VVRREVQAEDEQPPMWVVLADRRVAGREDDTCTGCQVVVAAVVEGGYLLRGEAVVPGLDVADRARK
jgi:hypothetical protein